METVPEGDLLRIGLFLMECVFEHIHKTTIKSKIYRASVLCVVSIMASLTLINLLHTKNELFLRTIETLITEYHLGTKYLLFIINKDVLKSFIVELKSKWPVDIAEPELKREIENSYNSMWKFLLILTFVAFLTVFTFFLQPIYNENPMMMEIWVPSDNPLITGVIWLMQSYILINALMVVIGTDSIFVAFCTHLFMQLQLLHQEYTKLYLPVNCTEEEEIEARRKLKICVQHHEYILRLFRGMRQVYSPLFLTQFFSTLISACSELFILSTNSQSFVILEVVNKFFYVLTILWQFGLYCFPAEYLTEELKKLSDAVYNSNWYETKTSFRKELVIVMAAAQKQSAFTAGGFSDVRMSTFTSVLKLSFSFYTLARNMVGKES